MNDCKHPEYEFYFDDFHKKNGKKCKQCKRSFVKSDDGEWVIVLTIETLSQFMKELLEEVKYV